MAVSYPNAVSDLVKFRDRVRRNPNVGTIDTKWFQDSLNIPVASNARKLEGFLEAGGFISNGELQPRGMSLVGPGDEEYKKAMRDAADEILGPERAESIRSGVVTRAGLSSYIQRQFSAGVSTVQK